MSYPVFYVPAGDVLPIFFDTYSGSTGASLTASGLAVTDIEIYKDGSTTQRSSDAGYTLLDTDGLDFDGLTGIHGFSIDTGDNTDASFYTVGAWFTVVVSTITVDSQTVSFIAAQFRIMPAESVAGKPKVDVDAWLGTAAATPTVAGVPEVDVTHYGGSAGTFASGRAEVNVSHFGGSAGTFSGGRAEVNVSHWRGTAAAAPTTAGVPAVELIDVSSAGMADLRSALGLASANLDTQIATLSTFNPATSIVEGTYTWVQTMRVVAAAAGGKASGLATTNAVYRNLSDTKDVIDATVDDDGNRTAVTLDVS